MYIWDMMYITCDTTHIFTWHDSYMCVAWLYTSDMTHIYTWHDSHYLWHDSYMYVTWLIFVCDMAVNMWHDPHIHVTWLTLLVTSLWNGWLYKCHDPYYIWHVPYYWWHVSYMHVTRHMYVRNVNLIIYDMPHSTCDMTHMCMWHDSFIKFAWLLPLHGCPPSAHPNHSLFSTLSDFTTSKSQELWERSNI